MKKYFFIFLMLFCGVATYPQKTFNDLPSLIEARENGSILRYRPAFFGSHQPLKVGESVIQADSNDAFKMRVVGGISWVWTPGDYYVIKNNVVVRRLDCGNQVYETAKLPALRESIPAPRRETSSLAFKPEKKSDVNVIVDVRMPEYPHSPVREISSGFPWLETAVGVLVGGILGYTIAKYAKSGTHHSYQPQAPPPSDDWGGSTGGAN